jgi:hypothetical protein
LFGFAGKAGNAQHFVVSRLVTDGAQALVWDWRVNCFYVNRIGGRLYLVLELAHPIKTTTTKRLMRLPIRKPKWPIVWGGIQHLNNSANQLRREFRPNNDGHVAGFAVHGVVPSAFAIAATALFSARSQPTP